MQSKEEKGEEVARMKSKEEVEEVMESKEIQGKTDVEANNDLFFEFQLKSKLNKLLNQFDYFFNIIMKIFIFLNC